MTDYEDETGTPPVHIISPSRLSFEGPKAPLFQALAEARKHYLSLTADSTADVQLKGGGGYKHAYADLDTVIKALTPGWLAAGLAVIQALDGDNVVTIVAKDESCLTVSCPMPAYDTPQQLGSASTYIKRYQLKSIFVVNDSEDDDGNTASGNKAQVTRKEPTAPKAQAVSMPKAIADEVTQTAKDKGLSGEQFRKVVFEQTGNAWKDCSELDAKKVLAALVLLP
jgi:hypothetical protein